MSDLIRRLRDEPKERERLNGLSPPATVAWHEACLEAADKIEQLETQNEQLATLYNDTYKRKEQLDSGLAERLRKLPHCVDCPDGCTVCEAADEIERLTNREAYLLGSVDEYLRYIDRLREALHKIYQLEDWRIDAAYEIAHDVLKGEDDA